MLDLQVSRLRPDPLYRQLADGITYAIATGRIAAGEKLPSLREAERCWDVNLHTVRRAYAEVERTGLVRTVPRAGTVVLAASERAQPPEDHPTDSDATPGVFVRECLAEAERRFGLTPSGFADRLLALADRDPPQVWVVECSRSLGSMLAEQLRARWQLRAAAVGLDKPPPPGVVVSTYFHYYDLRAALEARASDLSFVRIRPSEDFFEEVARAMADEDDFRRVVLLETDRSLAHNVGADLVQRFGPELRLEIRVLGAPTGGSEAAEIGLGGPDGAVLVVSPQNWDRLDEATRARFDVVPLRYDIDRTDLERIGAERSWRQ